MSKWTRQDLENIAKLAKLEIKEEDIATRINEFADILSYIDILNSVDVKELKSKQAPSLAMFEDQIQPSMELQDVLKNTDAKDSPFFFIPKVIEGGKQ